MSGVKWTAQEVDAVRRLYAFPCAAECKNSAIATH